ncbi:hypothetical protein [Epilithonimonas hispanica]|uniref:G domain-containing protein n=1 Tax=Epilithonimonas hispanica TaxID=358687 RepID=A0A3D9CVI5_9FLAO|nr:hypothetical protein [Epilithonimonas hispanica]REC69806.1 hypothetical protein DRF58_12010 [Epilithonimonas hispanica]
MLPILIPIAVLLSFLFRKKIRNFLKDGKSLGIIGMQQSGKTRFLAHLRNVPFIDKQTNQDDYPEFIYTTKSGSKIKINSGKDYGGLEMYRKNYSDIIKKSDVITYFFDINKYFNDMEYRRECNSRFLYLHGSFDKTENKLLVLFATHTDLCNNMQNKQIKKDFENLIKDKKYKELIKETIYVNTTNEDELKELNEILFK